MEQGMVIPLKRTEHKMVESLEEKEMQAVFDAVDINSRTGIRDRALLLFLYNTGAQDRQEGSMAPTKCPSVAQSDR